jgi:phospholipid/cholesterol/gamma-HCH transport system substrate-binding protein
MRGPLTALVTVAVAVAALVGGYALAAPRPSDHYSVVLANAIGVVEGTPVQLGGFDVGSVTGVTARDGKAVAEFAVGDLPRPLTSGSTVEVEWRSEIGERYLQLRPGPPGNPVLPSGAILESGPPQVLLSELVQSLDAPTRAHLTSFLRQLDGTLAGHQQDFNRTLRAAGPAMDAIGGVLDEVAGDGQAIKTVLTNLRQVTDVLAARRDALSGTVTDLNRLTSTAAVHQKQLGDGLAELPTTLDAVRGALDKLPAAAEDTVPLLKDLRPAAARLPAVAGDLNPVMERLRPVTDRLGPTLKAADDLLGVAPGFLNLTTDVLPQLDHTVDRVTPALTFLRPYTPEALGAAANFGNAMAGYDSNGHFLNVLLSEGKTSLTLNPPVTTLGERVNVHPIPGELVNQPWTDAGGSAPR